MRPGCAAGAASKTVEQKRLAVVIARASWRRFAIASWRCNRWFVPIRPSGRGAGRVEKLDKTGLRPDVRGKP